MTETTQCSSAVSASLADYFHILINKCINRKRAFRVSEEKAWITFYCIANSFTVIRIIIREAAGKRNMSYFLKLPASQAALVTFRWLHLNWFLPATILVISGNTLHTFEYVCVCLCAEHPWQTLICCVQPVLCSTQSNNHQYLKP